MWARSHQPAEIKKGTWMMTQILTQSWIKTRKVLLTPGTWTLAVWAIALVIGVALLILVGGGSAVFSLVSIPYSLSVSDGLGVIAGIFVLVLIVLAAWPFWMGGFYGAVAGALDERPITWHTFWDQGRENYGRAWGMVGYTALWLVALVVVFDIFAVVSRTLGMLVAFAAAGAMMPWFLQMVGGIFVDRRPWQASLTASIHTAHYGTLLLGTVTAVAMGTILMFVRIGLNEIPVIGLLLNLALSIGFSVAVVVWWLALYQSAQDGPLATTPDGPSLRLPVAPATGTPPPEAPIVSD